MKIDVELSDAAVREAVVRAWKELFQEPRHSGASGAAGYEIVKTLAAEHLAKAETVTAFRDMVKHTAAIIMQATVRDVVAEELRKLAKKVVKEERASGTLFDLPPVATASTGPSHA